MKFGIWALGFLINLNVGLRDEHTTWNSYCLLGDYETGHLIISLFHIIFKKCSNVFAIDASWDTAGKPLMFWICKQVENELDKAVQFPWLCRETEVDTFPQLHYASWLKKTHKNKNLFHSVFSAKISQLSTTLVLTFCYPLANSWTLCDCGS